MTARFVIIALFLMGSHGMEGKNLEFLFEKYIITKHFDENFLGCPVEIKMHEKPLNEIGHQNWTATVDNYYKLSSILSPWLLDAIRDLVPAVISRNHNGMGEKIAYISKELFQNENKVVMGHGNKTYAWILDRIVQKDGKPQKLFWINLYGEEVVFTIILDSAFLEEVKFKENDSLAKVKSGNNSFTNEKIVPEFQKMDFAPWKEKLVSYLSENPKGVLLCKLGEVCGKPRGFETQNGGLIKALELVPCVSIVRLLSKKNAQKWSHVAILQTKSRNKEQNPVLYPDVLNSFLAWKSPTEVILDDGNGEEVILDDEIENKLLPEDLLSPRQGKASTYESELKYLKNLPNKKD